MIQLNQFKSKTAICGYVVAVSTPVALATGDPATQIIAGSLAIAALLCAFIFARDHDVSDQEAGARPEPKDQ